MGARFAVERSVNNSAHFQHKLKRSYRGSSTVAILLSLLFFFTTFSGLAIADDFSGDLRDEYGDDPDIGKVFDSASPSKARTDSDDYGVSRAISKIFTLGYSNRTPLSTVNGEGPAQNMYFSDSKGYCDVNAWGAGTALYHNCDVPYVLTGLLQKFTKSGFTGAEKREIKEDSLWFGFPSEYIPSDEGKPYVPVLENLRDHKYTALEVYGYNLGYTQYFGEFDNIRQFSSWEALLKYDTINLLESGFKTVVNSLVGAGRGLVEGWSDGWSRGGFFSAIGGALGGFFSGGAGGAINTVVDTIEATVFNTFAWSRLDYGHTLYGARELESHEIRENIFAMLEAAVLANYIDPGEAPIPDDLASLQEFPRPPLGYGYCEPVGNAYLTQLYEENNQYFIARDHNGCGNTGDTEYNVTEWIYHEPEEGSTAERMDDWMARNEDLFRAANTYQVVYTHPEGERSPVTAYWVVKNSLSDDFYEVISQEWVLQNRTQAVQDAVTQAISPESLRKFMGNNPQYNFNAPWNRFVCVDENGNDVISQDGSSTLVFDIKKVGDDLEFVKTNCDIRPPVQNGAFGNGYMSWQVRPQNDTRTDFLPDPIGYIAYGIANNVSNFFLGLTGFVVKVTNTFLNFSFAPILSTLGIDEIMVTLLESFKDSVFYSFTGLMGALAGIVMLVRATRGGALQALKSFVVIIVVFIFSVVLLYRPEALFRIAEDIPTHAETAVATAIFEATPEESKLCQATGSRSVLSGNSEEGWVPGDGVRGILCEVWTAFYFYPYIDGQWGTNYHYLSSSATGNLTGFKNDNQSLVGSAKVHLGGGNNHYNWALYQLEQMFIGTTTTSTGLEIPGEVDSNMYRIVDAQAGLNNGEGKHSKYYESWSGATLSSSAYRNIVSLFAFGVSIMGALAIIAVAWTKIGLSLTTTLLILGFPFFALGGMIPGVGQRKYKEYLLTILSLMLQRVVLVGALALLIVFVKMFAISDVNYFVKSALIFILCLLFFRSRNKLLDLVKSGLSPHTLRVAGKKASDYLPLEIRNRVSNMREEAKAVTTGAVGGFLAGGVEGAIRESSRAKDQAAVRMNNLQTRKGFGVGQNLQSAAQIASTEAKQDLVDRLTGERSKSYEGTEPESKREVKRRLKEREQDATARNFQTEAKDYLRGSMARDKAHDRLNRDYYTNELRSKDSVDPTKIDMSQLVNQNPDEMSAKDARTIRKNLKRYGKAEKTAKKGNDKRYARLTAAIVGDLDDMSSRHAYKEHKRARQAEKERYLEETSYEDLLALDKMRKRRQQLRTHEGREERRQEIYSRKERRRNRRKARYDRAKEHVKNTPEYVIGAPQKAQELRDKAVRNIHEGYEKVQKGQEELVNKAGQAVLRGADALDKVADRATETSKQVFGALDRETPGYWNRNLKQNEELAEKQRGIVEEKERIEKEQVEHNTDKERQDGGDR